jgi:glycerate dehydrogenase
MRVYCIGCEILKIVVLDGYALNPGDLCWNTLKQLGNLTVYDRTPAVQVAERIGDAEIVFTNKTTINRETLNDCRNIKFIGVLATGYNIVDVEAAAERSIPVTNIPSYGTMAVAQFTIALLLEICHHVGDHSRLVKDGEWMRCPDFCFWTSPLIELSGKTMGLIGYGRIGQATAKIAIALGMRILAYDEYQNHAPETEDIRYTGLDDLLAMSDVVSLHCPLTAENNGFINSKTIAKMKDGALLINTSRGPLINEADLAEALRSGKLAYAAVDVVSAEPIREDNPLLSAPNILITPHIAWAPKEARIRLMDIAVNNLKSFLEGNTKNVVNM